METIKFQELNVEEQLSTEGGIFIGSVFPIIIAIAIAEKLVEVLS